MSCGRGHARSCSNAHTSLMSRLFNHFTNKIWKMVKSLGMHEITYIVHMHMARTSYFLVKRYTSHIHNSVVKGELSVLCVCIILYYAHVYSIVCLL